MRFAAAAARRLGRRGAILTVVGAGWVHYGVGVISAPRVGTERATEVLRAVAPMHVWGWGWVAAGALALGAAWSGSVRVQGWGFRAAAPPPLVWAGAYGTAGVLQDFPAAWQSAGVWLVISGVLAVTAGWADRHPAGTTGVILRE